jgi:hypothetical protein
VASPAVPRRRRTVALYVYTGATIVIGLAALAWASLTLDIWPEISLTQAGGKEGILLGLVFWILIGLLGGTRVEQLHGFGVLTFHLPFIIAATALGGPVAGGWVAMIRPRGARAPRGALVRHLANHSAMALSAVLGGIVYAAVVMARSAPSRMTAGGRRSRSCWPRSSCPVCRHPGHRHGHPARRPDLRRPAACSTPHRKTAASEVVLGWSWPWPTAASGGGPPSCARPSSWSLAGPHRSRAGSATR